MEHIFIFRDAYLVKLPKFVKILRTFSYFISANAFNFLLIYYFEIDQMLLFTKTEVSFENKRFISLDTKIVFL